jgi:tetratricopeptide (TPR) repeat protein/ferredoxin
MTTSLPLAPSDDDRAIAPLGGDRPGARPGRYSRWRAATLFGVYVLMAAHIAHWKITGRTLAPLELNEVMHTLELGIVTAGFLLMLAAFVSVAIFGRFFCSWGCHILALEDLCAWMLGRVGIRPRPVRSRVLLLVPATVMLYMFAWPQLKRVAAGDPAPAMHLRFDGEGWASFVTSDFWRNLPGPVITAITFAICGFAIVYVLGSRSFCTYVCPYGAIFNLADRVAPGRIKLRAPGACTGCAQCTAICESHVRVHEEIQEHGQVVDPACLKDLDCVSVCPEQAITFGFTRPSLGRSITGVARRRLRYDFTLVEELLMTAVFVGAVLSMRGLYERVPFFLSLGCAAIAAYLTILGVRLVTRPNVRLNRFQLKLKGRWTAPGRVFAALTGVLAVLLVHSGFIRWHEFRGNRAYERMREHMARGASAPPAELTASALHHAEMRSDWGLLRPAELDFRLASLHSFTTPPTRAAELYDRALRREPEALSPRVRYAEVLERLGRFDEAEEQLEIVLAPTGAPVVDRAHMTHVQSSALRCIERLRAHRDGPPATVASYERAIRAQPDRADLRAKLAERLVAQGDPDAAEAVIRAGLEIRPDSALLLYDLGVVLAMTGRDEEAIDAYRGSLRLQGDDADALNNLGLLLAGRGELAEAIDCFTRILEREPNHAQAHFAVGRCLKLLGRDDEASAHLARAAELSSRNAPK